MAYNIYLGNRLITDLYRGDKRLNSLYLQGEKLFTSVYYMNLCAIDLGGVGGWTEEIDALNELCTLLEAVDTNTTNIDALNSICTSLSYTSGWINEIDALNEICIQGGGIGEHEYEDDAWAEIQTGSLLNQSEALELTFTVTPVADTYEGIMTAAYADFGGGNEITGYGAIFGLGSLTPATGVLEGFDNACNVLLWSALYGGLLVVGYTTDGVHFSPVCGAIKINGVQYNMGLGLGQTTIPLSLNPFVNEEVYEIELLSVDWLNLEMWNTFFNLPTNGIPFTSVEVIGNTIKLFGGSNIIIGDSFFDDNFVFPLVSFVDNAGCITQVGNYFLNSNIYIENVLLPNLVTAGNYFIQNCHALNSVFLPKIETVGGYGLSANLLTSVSMPRLTTAGEGLLNGCELLTEVALPSLTSCGNYSLRDCILLTDVELPELITASHDLLYGSTSLVSVSLPKLVITGHALCYECTSLVSASFPSLESCEEYSFQDCVELTTLDLSSMSDLGGTVGFDGCFTGIKGQTITLTIPAALMTCNEGNPDDDIAYLIANNTVTVITV